MSITGFEDAIKDNVASYSSNLDALRATNVMARNNALAGLQSEVEKYGEMAKLGLEIPVAVEGLKQVGGRAKDLVNYIKGAPAKLEEAKGAIKGAVDTALSRGNSAKQAVGGAVGDLRDSLSQRLDNLRSTSAYGGTPLQPGEEMGTNEQFRAMRAGAGETKMEFNPTARIKENAMRSKSRFGMGQDDSEMRRPRVSGDDMGDNPDPYGRDSGGAIEQKADFSYGGGVSSGETKTSAPAETENFEGFDNTDEYGLPRASEPLGTGEPSLFSHEEPRFSTQRGLDAGFENDRMGIGNMGLSQSRTRGAPLRKQPGQGYNDLDTEERAPPRPTSKAPGPGAYDDELSQATTQTASTEASSASNLAENITEDAVSSGAGEVAGGVEEGLGAGLLASGIFAPLGALLEGIGAVTEVGSVGAGIYGAVQSFSEQGQEEALRNTPLPQVSQPTLDLGGRVSAPLLA